MREIKFIKNILNKVTGKEEGQETINLKNFKEVFPELMSSDLSEVTYYTCLKVLSESLGKLSLHLYDKDNNRVTNHEAVKKLTGRVNPYMTPTNFKTLLEYWRNHYGNSYAYLSYDNVGHLLGIYPLDPTQITIWVDNKGLFGGRERVWYEYNNPNGKTAYYSSSEILHLKGGLSRDGLVGKSIREELATTLKGAKASQKYLNNLYDKGLTAKAILKYTGDLNKEKEKTLLSKMKEFINFHSNDTNIMPLPPGMDIVPLDLKLTDSQFFELKKFNSLQVAAAFGVKPNHLNNYEKSSYANSEMQNLTFYIDTLLYILTLYEEEFDLKLLTDKERAKGYKFKFNVASILRGDLKTQAECLRTYVTSGIYTINEARKLAGLTEIEEGEVIVMNGSYVPLDQLGAAYQNKKGGGED